MIDASLPPTDFCCSADPDAGYVGGIAHCNASVQGIDGCPFDPPVTFDMLLRASPGGPLPWNAALIVNEHDNYGACPAYSPTDRVHTCFTFGAWTSFDDESTTQSPLFALTITYAGGPGAWSKCYGAPPCPPGYPVDPGGACCQSASASTPGGGGYQFTLLPLAVLDFDGGVSSGPAIGIPGIDPDPTPAPTPPEPTPEAGPPAPAADAGASDSARDVDAIAVEASASSDAGDDQVEASADATSAGAGGCSVGPRGAAAGGGVLWALALCFALWRRRRVLMLPPLFNVGATLQDAMRDHPTTKPRIADLAGRLAAHLYRACSGLFDDSLWSAIGDPERQGTVAQALHLAFADSGWKDADFTFRHFFTVGFLDEAIAMRGDAVPKPPATGHHIVYRDPADGETKIRCPDGTIIEPTSKAREFMNARGWVFLLPDDVPKLPKT